MRAVAADGLVLEPQTAAHAEAMFVVLSDPAIYEYENEPPRSLEWLRDRFRKLESRVSPDGTEQWLNWVIRLPGSELAGYVQATVHADGRAAIAYELSSAYWGRGLAHRAVAAMIRELAASYHVRTVTAVFKKENQRSRHLLERLGFLPASREWHGKYHVDADEEMMRREARLHG
jgi:RimJ/RimL family protein N-acetyltransferase